jgi:D-alanyl-D-alanine carboxypeptidase
MVGKRTQVLGVLVLLGLAPFYGCGGDTQSASSGSGGTGQGQTERTSDLEGTRFSDENARKVNDFVAQQMQENDLPGVVVGVWEPDEGELIAAEGEANLETGREREPDDPFRIASITKTFTGTAVLQLVDEGKLSTSDKISTWYPDFPNADRITIRDLLMMRSGIPDPYNKQFLSRFYANPTMDYTAQDSIEDAAARADEFTPPNEKTVYTNVNFTILEEIVQKVSGQDLATRIPEGILRPLGMRNSLYPTDYQLPGELRGYSLDAQSNEFVDKTVLNPAVPGGAGAMISDLTDLRTYSEALCTGEGLLQPETQSKRLQAMTLDGEPEFIKYGEGVEFLGDFCGHNGTIFGFSSEMFYLPQEDAVIIVNVNRLDEDDESKSTDIFMGVSKILYPDYVEW